MTLMGKVILGIFCIIKQPTCYVYFIPCLDQVRWNRFITLWEATFQDCDYTEADRHQLQIHCVSNFPVKRYFSYLNAHTPQWKLIVYLFPL